MTGTTLDSFDYVPRKVLDYLSQQLRVNGPELTSLRAIYRRQMTLFLHQRWACEHAGLSWPNAADIAQVVEALVAGSAVTLDRSRLARQAREELFARRCLIPRERDIEDWVRQAIHMIELEDRRRLNEAIPASVRESWLPRLLCEASPGPMTVLEWIRRPSCKRSKKTLNEEMSKLQGIRALSPPESLEGIPAQRLRGYGCGDEDRSEFVRLPSRGARWKSLHC